MFIILSIYLLILGIRKKYGGLMYCYNHYKHGLKFNKIQFEDIDHENRSVISWKDQGKLFE